MRLIYHSRGAFGWVVFSRYGYVKYYKKTVKNGQKRTRERMSDQEAKEIKAEAEEIMPQPEITAGSARHRNKESQRP
ncbi:hypothetical protein Tco_1494922, partial [Tanacetum coccineum]